MATPSGIRPGTISTVIHWIGGMGILAMLVWLPRTSALYFALCAGTHVEAYEADLNHDGYVSVVEAGYACNVDSRPIRRDGKSCIQYYNRVDWRQVKLDCE